MTTECFETCLTYVEASSKHRCLTFTLSKIPSATHMEFVDGVCNTTLRYGYILLVFRRLHSKCLTLRQCIVVCCVCVCVKHTNVRISRRATVSRSFHQMHNERYWDGICCCYGYSLLRPPNICSLTYSCIRVLRKGRLCDIKISITVHFSDSQYTGQM